ncbi:amidohydrolase [Agrococcus sp. SGAir0287]|uniref:amidohydrolase n=1 Tax=Agrococcus sp. SGAir0287 TaxID=2070347 RepID=UPI0010CD4E25|nr:amidohydrolase [Agrococcus sp. SGAir0287]QCR20516.1 amidohydrolase [Agrococcus sp. SGAir0287]
MRVLDDLASVRPFTEELYRHLHAHPELSDREHETAARMAAELRATGVDEVHEGVGASTGVVGILRNGEGPTILVRADMDGLPVVEDAIVEYRSTQTAEIDGQTVGVMHACGHDVHMATLQGSVRLLAEHRDAWSGTLVVVFQPAEETIGGARGMTDALRAIVPDIDVALGQHVGPYPASSVRIAPGPVMAACDELIVTIHGRGGHGSQPETTVDPVVLAASIVLRLQTIVSREIPSTAQAVLTVGTIHAGTKSNIIPDTARLGISMRTYDEELRTRMRAAVERIVQAECQAAGAPEPATIERTLWAPVTDNDPETTATLTAALAEEFGDDVHPMVRLSGSEDFSELAAAYGRPYAFWFTGGIDDERYAAAEAAGTLLTDIPSNHSPGFVPVLQPTLDTAVRAMTTAVLAHLGR